MDCFTKAQIDLSNARIFYDVTEDLYGKTANILQQTV